jgi:WD40 repeat protein
VFAGSDTIISAQEDGSILLWNIKEVTNTTIYLSITEKPLCLAWNNNKKVLFAGCSDGSILSFDFNSNKSAEPLKYPVHTAGIDLMTFNYDFSMLATSSWDKTIKFYRYHEFFELGNTVGGVVHLKNLNQRIRSMIFTDDNKLIAGLSDKSIRVWETSSPKIALKICELVKRNMTIKEWNDMVGQEIPYEKTCGINP